MSLLKSPLTKLQLSRKRKSRKPVFNFSHRSTDLGQRGVVSLPEAWERESPRCLGTNINALDTIRFCGVNKAGGIVVTSITRCQCRRAEVVVYLRLPSGDEFQLPTMPDTSVYNTDGKSFSAAGLTFELLEPLKRWRIIFNGYLRKAISKACSTDESNVFPARFSFVWHPSFSYVAFPDDFSDAFLIQLMSKTGLSSPWDFFDEEWHEQFGELNGKINIDGEDECQLYIRGLKSRRHGNFDCGEVTKKLSVQGILHNGMALHLFVVNPNKDKVESKDLIYGYLCPPCNTTVHHFNNCTLNVEALQGLTSKLNATFIAGGVKYSLQLDVIGPGFSAYEGEMWECQTTTRHISLTLNGKEGDGLMDFTCHNDEIRGSPPLKSLQMLTEQDVKDFGSLVVSFDDPKCSCSSEVGGKGSSLALMTTWFQEYNLFEVPSGICVTKFAFNQHLLQNPALVTAIEHLQNVAWANAEGSLPEECHRVEELFVETEASKELILAIEEGLTKSIGKDYKGIKFAVRSSAIGEDGEDMSSAGQNETYLGVKGVAEIRQSLIKCWASQFSFRSTEYKRQNGQILTSGMAVVIQEMISADAAGVLFSRDPISGSLTKMVIASNYGLGESVVSATVDPDSIILKRSFNDILSVHSKDMGSKKTMIKMADGSGTMETTVNDHDSEDWSISEETALRLGEIALLLEKCFGRARDIEWAVVANRLFILQSRPVTSENSMSDFDVLHEFASPLRTDNERLTTANVGEVMPGAIVPLTATSIVRAQTVLFQYMVGCKVRAYRYDPTVHEGLANHFGHMFFDRLQLKSFSLEKTKNAMTKSTELGFYGRVLDDPDVVELANDRYENVSMMTTKVSLMKWTTKGMLFGKKMTAANYKMHHNMVLSSMNATSAFDAYTKAGDQLFGIIKVAIPHMTMTMISSTWNLIILNILSKGNEDFSMEQYSDFAMLIGSANGAVSGDVPFSLQELAQSIALEKEPQLFLQESPEEALNWLQESGGPSCTKFKEFLKNHGHRGLKEFDCYSISWGMNNIELVIVLQEMLKTPACLSTAAQDVDPTKVVNPVNQIKTPLTPFKKKILSYLMKKCREGVCLREATKSMVIKFYDSYRLAYRHLADLMIHEGFIPEPNLIFFMTFEEIGTLLKTRSAKIIQRARQRLKLNSYMDGMKFPEMVDGFPEPDDGTLPLQIANLDGSVIVKGYPVSQGIVQGPARVVQSLNDLNTIQAGEILVTYSTDIGWSPYFPMLIGIVTEIGGLISHGAVVAREFGLPCIVGAANATKLFKSGDLVQLNAMEGTLVKIVV